MVFQVGQSRFAFSLSMNENDNSVAPDSKKNDCWENRFICIYQLDNCYKFAGIVLHELWVHPVLRYYGRPTLVMTNKKFLFLHIVDILGLDIIHNDVVEELSKVNAEQLNEHRYFSLSVNR